MSTNVAKKVFKRKLETFKRNPAKKHKHDNSTSQVGLQENDEKEDDSAGYNTYPEVLTDHRINDEETETIDPSTTVKSTILTDVPFSSLNGRVSESTLKAISKMGFTRMTEIQLQAIEPLLMVIFVSI